eukprot:5655543-Amphidinium_carterae.3
MAIYHGSFAPMHPGHCAMIRDSMDFLEANDVEVCFAALAVTDDRQLTQKLTYEDNSWNASNRIHIARWMLLDANMSEMVTVSERSFGSPHALAASLGMKLPAIYVYGSDC